MFNTKPKAFLIQWMLMRMSLNLTIELNKIKLLRHLTLIKNEYQGRNRCNKILTRTVYHLLMCFLHWWLQKICEHHFTLHWETLILLPEHKIGIRSKGHEWGQTLFSFPVWYRTTHTVNGVRRWVFFYLLSTLDQMRILRFQLFDQLPYSAII